MNDPTPTDDKHEDADELVRLREHNRQLLAELKEARAALKPAQEALEAAQARLRVALVDEPMRAIAERCSPLPGAFLRALKDRIDVVLDDEYRPHVVGKDGKPIEWEHQPYANGPGEVIPVEFTGDSIFRWLHRHFPYGKKWDEVPEDVRELVELLNRASGTGALGSTSWAAGSAPAAPKQESQPQPQPPAFGLR